MKEKNIKKFKSILNNKNGITLIALVITIIVMLILVGVTITMAVNGGLFTYSGNAAHDTELAKQDELKIAEASLEVDGKKYDSPEDFIAGVESGSLLEYSASLLNSNKVLKRTVKYTDTNNDKAIIPKGFGIVEDCGTINQGLVISDEFDSNGKSVGNEFVWIPIPEKNMKVATLSDQYLRSTCYFEPKELNATDSNTGSATGGPYARDSQEELDWYYGENYFTYGTDFQYEKHYKEMAKSVNEYGGFYIGRYETTIDSSNKIGSKYNTTILTSEKKIKLGTNSNNSQPYYYRWWGLYYSARHANISGNGSVVQTNMIWGQEWDKMIAYFDSKSISYSAISTSIYNKPSGVLASGQATYINKTDSTDVISDKIFNIYDLRMNAFDWTAEAFYNLGRVRRGGCYSHSDSASTCSNTYTVFDYPYSNYYDGGMRLTLYIR